MTDETIDRINERLDKRLDELVAEMTEAGMNDEAAAYRAIVFKSADALRATLTNAEWRDNAARLRHWLTAEIDQLPKPPRGA